MSVSTTTNKATFAGNGVTTAFSYPYHFQSSGDLTVILKVDSTGVETTKTITTHYTVSGTATNGVYPSGGTVTMLSAPATGETLIILCDPDLTQTMDAVDNEALPAETLEQAIDKCVLMIQRLDERVDRAIKKPEGFTATFDMTFPWDLDDAADKVPLVNTGGTGWADCSLWPTGDDIVNAEANATAAAASAAAAALGAASITGTRASPSLIVAGTGITFGSTSYNNVYFIAGSGGAVDVSANPQIGAGSAVGQRIVLIGRHDTNTVKLEDGTGLALKGDWYSFASEVLELIWDGTNWVEVNRS